MQNSEPVITANGIVAAISAIIAALIVFGVISWNEEQQRAFMAAVVAILGGVGPLIAAWWVRSRVVSKAKVKEIRDTAYLRGQDSIRMAKAPVHVDR